MNIALALNNEKVTEALTKNGYNIVADFKDEKELNEISSLIERPDILVLSANFCDMSVRKVSSLKNVNPYTRFIYIMSDADYTSGTRKKASKLIQNNIYDIHIGEVKLGDLIKSIENPKSFEEVSELLETSDNDSYPNVTTVASLKPGSGKTFLATNLAVAIADYGQDKRVDGRMKRPRVLLLDGDLLNLSVSTMTRVDNYDRNMLTALKKIGQLVNEDGSYNMDINEVDQIQKFVRNCLALYKGKDNLYVMAATDIPFEDLEGIAPSHFYFMVQMLHKAFDVVIVDSNSAFDHQTTPALYELSGRVLLLLDNDYNNIQNNIRYIDRLSDLGYDDKIHFIVNKDLTWNQEQECLENLAYDTKTIGDLMIEHRIPFGNPGTIKTIDYGDKLLVETNELPDVKKAILDIADDIWKIDSYRVSQSIEPEPKKKPNRLIAALNK